MREQARQRHLRRKLAALRRYGDHCVCCGEHDYRFLTLDHGNGDGAAHRKALLGNARHGGGPFLIALERQGWPDVPGLRTLCSNCHMALDLWGACRHQEEWLVERLGLDLPLAKAILNGEIDRATADVETR